jgi:hypothetical protein
MVSRYWEWQDVLIDVNDGGWCLVLSSYLVVVAFRCRFVLKTSTWNFCPPAGKTQKDAWMRHLYVSHPYIRRPHGAGSLLAPLPLSLV